MSHLLDKIHNTVLNTEPFWHCFIEGIFPESFYSSLLSLKQEIKNKGLFQARSQDSAFYVNRRHRLINSSQPQAKILRRLFSRPELIHALLDKFYLANTEDLLARIRVHREFEFVFCHPNRFQDIHVDIPPKVLSFVFYLPDDSVSGEIAEANATILYDKHLRPSGAARYLPNSVCIFAPHFYTYHGFSTTINRDVMVLFYIDRRELLRWDVMNRASRVAQFDRPPFDTFKQLIAGKLSRSPLREYGLDSTRISLEVKQCLINSPQGRVRIPGHRH